MAAGGTVNAAFGLFFCVSSAGGSPNSGLSAVSALSIQLASGCGFDAGAASVGVWSEPTAGEELSAGSGAMVGGAYIVAFIFRVVTAGGLPPSGLPAAAILCIRLAGGCGTGVGAPSSTWVFGLSAALARRRVRDAIGLEISEMFLLFLLFAASDSVRGMSVGVPGGFRQRSIRGCAGVMAEVRRIMGGCQFGDD